MFDIKEYFEEENKFSSGSSDIVAIDEDIAHDINSLLSTRFDSLYRRDRYKHGTGVIDIIYPSLRYPGNNPAVLNPDRIRYLLSFYPQKSDLVHIDKIVMRPRYVEIGNIELVSLYLRRKKILVLYLCHPHFYKMRYAQDGDGDENGVNLEEIMAGRLVDDSVRRDENSDMCVHPLWYLLSVAGAGSDDLIDKFFIKKDTLGGGMYEILNDISFYYSRHGY